MDVDGKKYCMIWLVEDGMLVEIIDQIKFLYMFEIVCFCIMEDVVYVICVM